MKSRIRIHVKLHGSATLSGTALKTRIDWYFFTKLLGEIFPDWSILGWDDFKTKTGSYLR